MCAIGGIAGENLPPGEGPLAAMARAMAHRGPDGEGFFAEGNVRLLHRLLRLHDPRTLPGPYESADGRWVLSFNGEIYNHEEVSRRLHLPRRLLTDAETLLEGWALRGDAILADLNGMFAFALWDRRERKLTLGRDRLGEKPLYYASRGGTLVFASEIRGLIAAGVEPWLDEEALPEYFAYRYVSGPRTLFRGVRKLAPGHLLRWPENRIHAYWRLPAPRAETRAGDREELAHLLADSHRLRATAHARPAVFLSEGIDSATVASFLPQESLAFTFSSRLAPREADGARELCRARGLCHEEVRLGDLEATAHRAIEAVEEPLADSILLPTWALASAASAHTRAVLSGEGADELFGGYVHHWVFHHTRPLLSRPRLTAAAAGLVSRLPPGLLGRLRAYPADFGGDGKSRLLGLLESLGRGGMGSSLTTLFPGEGRRSSSEASLSSLRELLDLDLTTWLPDYSLLRMDKILMRFGVEGRFPFLDHRIVELASRLPPGALIRGFERKRILRRAVAGKVRASRRKTPFVLDLSLGECGSFLDPYESRLRYWRERSGLPLSVSGDSPFLRRKKLFAVFALESWARSFRLPL